MTKQQVAIGALVLFLLLAWRFLPRYEIVPVAGAAFVRHDKWTGKVESVDSPMNSWFDK